MKPGISDHEAVIADIQLKAKVSKKNKRLVYMYDRVDHDTMKKEICKVSQEIVSSFSTRNADENWQLFKHSITRVIKELVPSKWVKGRHDLPWLDNTIKKKIAKKNRFHRRAKRASPKYRAQ